MPLSLARKVIRWELGLWHSTYLWARRRVRGVGPGDVAIGYTGATAPVMWALIILNAIEIPALHIMLPWETVRIIVDLAGVYSLIWMIGLMATMKVHPHLATGAGLRVRYGTSVDFTIPWQAIAGIGARIRSLQGNRTVRFEESILRVGVGSQTNIDIVLRSPLALPVPRTGGEPVTEVRVYADDTKALIAEVRSRLNRADGRNGSTPGTSAPARQPTP